MRFHYILIGGLAAVLLLTAAIGVGWYHTKGEITTELVPPSIGGPFTLTDGDGHPVTDETYRGKWLVVYFGYTYCPDACPTGLSNIGAAMKLLGADADRVQTLLITVDPERDTPEVMKSYVAAFDSRFVGLTGTPEQIAAVARSYRAYYKRIGEGDDYIMDHTVVIYIMDPDGHYRTMLRHTTPPAEIAETLKKLL